jgi:gamma-aminobutyric acid type B receptor
MFLQLIFFVFPVQSSATLALESQDPYLQIYPPVNETDGRTPLYFALVLSFGGSYKSIGALPGVQIALDYINSERSILPGYSLHYTLTDSQCDRSTAIRSYFTQMTNPPTKVGWVGSGCSPATEPTAELTQYHNIAQVSCISSSPDLYNRQRFRYYFQLLSNEVPTAYGFYSIIQYFGWKRVGIITQGENLFIATSDVLKRLLTENGDIEYTEWYFRSEESVSKINIFESGIRIYVVEMYSINAIELFCKAYRSGILPPKYLFLTLNWYVEGWWGEGHTSEDYNCTADELAAVALYNVAPVLAEFPANDDAVAEPNITFREFRSLYYKAVQSDYNENNTLMEYNDYVFPYAYHCHEATLTFAYSLNKTITDLADNFLNREAAEESGLPEGETFTMANFTYANSAVVSRMFEHLQSTMFHGITGNDVIFNDQGTRIINRLKVSQYQKNANGTLHSVYVGDVTFTKLNVTFHPLPTSFSFPEGIPNDGIPIEDVVTVSVALTVVYVILATAGLVFAVACILFNIIFREKRLIRLSSPNLNYLIGLGAIVLYLNVITLVIPTTNTLFAAVLCNINPWLISLGYSLCYGTIIIKMIRVWVIFNNPLQLKTSFFRDYLMALFVLSLAIIDVVILLTYTATEAVRDNLGVKLTANRELPNETFGATAEQHKYFFYICESDGQVVLYAILFGYKGILQVLALLLAFRTRNVKVKGLDDSVYIAASVYVTSIVLTVIIVSTYTLRDYVNAYPAVVGMGLLLGTTMILGLVFIPRMVGLYKDPKGETISTFGTSGPREEAVDTSGSSKDKELQILRRRISQLETCLKQQHASAPVGKESPIFDESKTNGNNTTI